MIGRTNAACNNGELHGAAISVTTEEITLIEKEVSLSKDSFVVDTKTFDDNGSCSFIDIQDPGDYTVSASDGTDSTSETVTITSDNIVNKTVLSCVLSLIPDGSTVTPVDDVAIWLKCAGSKAGYTSTAEVLSDADTMFALTSDENAMKYLERSTSFADDLCNDETFMTYLGQSPYVDNTVLNSDLWVSSISSSAYWDLVYPVVTVHSSACATITIAGKSFTSDATGDTQHSMPWGTFSISDSVSGQSFERTIGRDTTDVYVMPNGLVLYWYGNENVGVTGGLETYVYAGAGTSNSITKNTNSIVVKMGSYDSHAAYNNAVCVPKNRLTKGSYTKAFINCESTLGYGMLYFMPNGYDFNSINTGSVAYDIMCGSMKSSTGIIENHMNNVVSSDNELCFGIIYTNDSTATYRAIWFE